MTATYTFDVFSSLDGFGSYSGGDWGGYWGKQGTELLARRLAVYGPEHRMVFGARNPANSRNVLAPKTIRCSAEYSDSLWSSSSGPCLPQ